VVLVGRSRSGADLPIPPDTHVRGQRSIASAWVTFLMAMTELRLRTVDAFTDQPFTGNPAAVVVLDEAPPNDWSPGTLLG
jgi:hypothetical protein